MVILLQHKSDYSLDLSLLHKRAASAAKENKKLIAALSKMDTRKLDELVHQLHNEVFEEINCLECANCCRTLGPRITDRDIARISSSLRIRPAVFTKKYLRKDEDGDYVFISMPCPFIGRDNYCSVYDDRPKACREYPHTDRKRFYQILPLTLKNTYVCPAVFEIAKRLKER